MEYQEELSPHSARDAAGFVESMQKLKERSGLTYRDLEERAARNGDVLARSTLADILKRTSLPRPDLLVAFVRACGDEPRVGAWLEARSRIAAADPAAGPAAVPGPAADGEATARPSGADPATPRKRLTKRRKVAGATSLVVLGLALAAWALLPDSPGTSSRLPADGWVTIRPARTPDLCLTDGRDRKGAYDNAVAVQLPCAQAAVPRTYLEPVGEGLYRIQWLHPVEGKGCLAVMSTGPVKGMLQPLNDCAKATLFRLEPAGSAGAEDFRFRPVNSSRCIGIAGDDTSEGAEATEEQCTHAADQRFLIRAD
ncbi:RICIN domain-containing protein [Streptomyces sp. NBC_01198]|uniref:RICIN domain-containing protein n=1 Tax=Streptomyces sp. NBC_01198 TaxID=2903769 RepID=UPI002E0D8CDF|nr:XRE family transcriptional regulator [Streptomyces sp. NBC_01198]